MPLIVPPTWNKTDNVEIVGVWNQAIKELSEAQNIIIIGYSLPKTDLFFQYLLALGTLNIQRLKRFWVVDTNPDVDKKYQSFLSNDIKRKYEHLKDKNGNPRDFLSSINYLRRQIKELI